jgi:hypothetical protein
MIITIHVLTSWPKYDIGFNSQSLANVVLITKLKVTGHQAKKEKEIDSTTKEGL